MFHYWNDCHGIMSHGWNWTQNWSVNYELTTWIKQWTKTVKVTKTTIDCHFTRESIGIRNCLGIWYDSSSGPRTETLTVPGGMCHQMKCHRLTQQSAGFARIGTVRQPGGKASNGGKWLLPMTICDQRSCIRCTGVQFFRCSMIKKIQHDQKGQNTVIKHNKTYS